MYGSFLLKSVSTNSPRSQILPSVPHSPPINILFIKRKHFNLSLGWLLARSLTQQQFVLPELGELLFIDHSFNFKHAASFDDQAGGQVCLMPCFRNIIEKTRHTRTVRIICQYSVLFVNTFNKKKVNLKRHIVCCVSFGSHWDPKHLWAWLISCIAIRHPHQQKTSSHWLPNDTKMIGTRSARRFSSCQYLPYYSSHDGIFLTLA